MAARFDAINAQGGVFGRRIEWRAIDGGATPASASAALRAVLSGKQDLFALVGSLLPDPDADLQKLLQSRDLPMVATLGIAQTEPQAPELTYLLAPLQAQLAGLAAEMKQHCEAGDGVRKLVYPEGAPLQGLVSLALPQWQPVAVSDRASARLQTAAQTTGTAARQVIALMRRDQLAAWQAEWNAPGGPDCVGTLAVVSGQSASGSPARYAQAVALPMPPVVQDSTQPAGAALWPLLGDMAASVFAEALARAGRNLDPQAFADALNTLHRFQPINGLSVTFGPQQRHGFDVTYFWKEKAHDTLDKTP
jgi:branched-chain amino acid transport system substrate-binding protein